MTPATGMKNKFGEMILMLYLCTEPIQNTMSTIKIESNQYIPRNGKSLASGMPACATYYYFVNENGKVLDKDTLKPYRGKQMNRYAMYSKDGAENYLEKIKNKFGSL